MNRRTILAGLGAGLLTPWRAQAKTCSASPPMVTGPFPPPAFREKVGSRPNPGAWLEVSENDFDLATVAGASAKGQVVTLEVLVFGGDCKSLPGVQLEMWQADAKGHYNHKNETRVDESKLDPGFGYWGTTTTDESGKARIRTIVPGAYPAGQSWWRPPHLHWSLQAPGRKQVTTQSYFEGDALDGIEAIRQQNLEDFILQFQRGFEMNLTGKALDAARKQAHEELVVRFVPREDQIPHGTLILRG